MALPLLEILYGRAHVPLESYFHLLPDMPRGETVKDLLERGFPQTSHLLDGFMYGAALTALRVLFTHSLLKPIGRWALRQRYANHQANPELDAILAVKKYPDREDYLEVAKRLKMKEVEVKAYFRHARNHAREEVVLQKLMEAMWKLGTYFLQFVLGLTFVLRERWLWDPHSCWADYPFTHISKGIYLYYMIELGTFTHELINLFTDHRRKDFYAMLTHHVSTIILIAGSYLAGFVPIGSLVMLVHDAADSILEAAKVFNYLSKPRPWAQAVTDTLFVMFAVTFFCSRCVAYPTFVLHNALTMPWRYIGPYKGAMALDVFLCVLQCLHVYWMYLILRMAAKMVIKGTAEKDDRSDDGSDMEASDDDEKKKT